MNLNVFRLEKATLLSGGNWSVVDTFRTREEAVQAYQELKRHQTTSLRIIEIHAFYVPRGQREVIAP